MSTSRYCKPTSQYCMFTYGYRTATLYHCMTASVRCRATSLSCRPRSRNCRPTSSEYTSTWMYRSPALSYCRLALRHRRRGVGIRTPTSLTPTAQVECRGLRARARLPKVSSASCKDAILGRARPLRAGPTNGDFGTARADPIMCRVRRCTHSPVPCQRPSTPT